MLIGQSGIGKTLLMEKILYERIPATTSCLQTLNCLFSSNISTKDIFHLIEINTKRQISKDAIKPDTGKCVLLHIDDISSPA